MLRTYCYSVVGVLSLLPSGLMAGGPPYLSLPVNGIDADNVQACSKLLNTKLADKAMSLIDNESAIMLRERKGQWYVTFYMDQNVNLSDINATLKDTRASVLPENLRLFGHAILDIDAGKADRQKLRADLDALPNVSVDESKDHDNMLHVTVDMPYPADDHHGDRERAGWDQFRRSDLSSTNESRELLTADKLPTLKQFQEIIAKREAKLKDIHWSVNHACRVLGGVANPNTKQKQQRVSAVP